MEHRLKLKLNGVPSQEGYSDKVSFSHQVKPIFRIEGPLGEYLSIS